MRGESCRVTSFLGLATSLAECCDTSFFAFLQFVEGSSTDDDSSDVREGALACLWVLLSDTFFFGCIKRNNYVLCSDKFASHRSQHECRDHVLMV